MNNSNYSAKLVVAALTLVALAITFLAWRYTSHSAERLANERFHTRVVQIDTAIQDRMLAYEHVLRGGVGLFAASNNVSRQEWHNYVANVQLHENYPGIQGMGFSLWIPPSGLTAHITQIRHEGFPDYTVKPAGTRPAYTSIIYLEPFDARNKRAFGFDMFSEPTRRAAMEIARDTGKASVSGKVKLVQETKQDVQNGFLMYMPVYRGARPDTVAQRRTALMGFVYSPFRINDLMQGILGKAIPDVTLQIYDGTHITDDAMLYKSNNSHHTALFSDTRKIDINGHTWTLRFSSLPVFEQEVDRHTPNIVAVSGLALSTLLTLLLISLLNTRARALELAKAMTVTVRENEERFHSVVDTAADGIIVISETGLIEFCNLAAQHIFGYPAEEMIGNNINILMPEPYHSQHDGYLAHYLRTSEAHIIGSGREVAGLHKDGSTFPMELSVGEMHAGGQRKFTGMVRDISERKRSQEILGKTMRLQQAILESASYAIISTTVDGTIMLFNPAAERMLGYTAEELVGKTTPALIHLPQEVVTRAESLSLELGQTIEPGFDVFVAKSRLGSTDTNEWTYLHKDGHPIPVLLSVTAQRDENGTITGFLGIASDISERKAFEAALRDSEARYRLMAEYSSDMISRFSNHGKINYVSPASNSLLGYDPAAMQGKSLFEWIHPDDMAMAENKLDTVLNTNKLDTLTCRVRHHDGNYIWMETSLRGLQNNLPDSEPYIIGVSRNVTERVQTTASLNRFKHILDNTLDMLFMFDPDTLRFIYLNKGAAEHMGYTPEELLQMTPYQIKPLISEANFHQLIAPLLSGEQQSLNFETLHRRKDGSDFPVEIFLQLVKEVDNKGVFVAIVRDITERKKIDKLKNEFVSTVSHELRTPLTSIRGSLGLVAGGVAGEISAKAKELIDIAYKNSERLVRLINDMLDIEKIESGKMTLDLKSHALMPLIEQAVEANRAYGEAYGVTFEITETIPGVHVLVDQDRLLQVMANLLSNAAKFSPANGLVKIAVVHGNLGVRVMVIDQGTGVPDAFRHQIFQKFSQADSSDTRQKGGTGLGLNITKAIIEKMHGVIGFDSATGAGSMFYIELPEYCADGICLTHQDKEHSILQNKPLSILICEDDADIAKLLSIMLNDGGFITDIAHDAQQAKELLRSSHYDAMTLDIGLPGQDGLSLLQELRSHAATAQLPIVVVSAQTEQGRAEINGSYALLEWHDKPINRELLLSQLHAVISQQHEHYLPRILHVEDDPDVRQILSSIGQDIAEFDHAGSIKQAAAKLAQQHYDLIVLDLSLPDGSGLSLMPHFQKLNATTPVMIFSVANVTRLESSQVASVLIKSCTTNQELLSTITKLITKT